MKRNRRPRSAHRANLSSFSGKAAPGGKPTAARMWWVVSAVAGAVVALVALVANVGQILGVSARDYTPTDSWLGVKRPLSSVEASSVSSGGWGPARDPFSTDNPPDYVVMNSIVDNPVHGDERNFVQIRKAQDSNTTYADEMRAGVGDTLVVYAWVANDASDLVDSKPATLQGLHARLYVGAAHDSKVPLSVLLQAKNATEVWDGVLISIPRDASVEYVPGSAWFHTNSPGDNGYAVPDFDFGDGGSIALGYSAPDGNLPVGTGAAGDYRGHGYLTFRVVVSS